eukprot:6032914-Amphidinium_carterae.1
MPQFSRRLSGGNNYGRSIDRHLTLKSQGGCPWCSFGSSCHAVHTCNASQMKLQWPTRCGALLVCEFRRKLTAVPGGVSCLLALGFRDAMHEGEA